MVTLASQGFFCDGQCLALALALLNADFKTWSFSIWLKCVFDLKTKRDLWFSLCYLEIEGKSENRGLLLMEKKKSCLHG